MSSHQQQQQQQPLQEQPQYRSLSEAESERRPVPFRMDRQSLTWSRVIVSQSPPPRSGAASVVIRSKLYVFGGYGGGTGRLDDFYSYDFSTSSWEEVSLSTDIKPGCRENNGVVLADENKIYLFGGYNGTSWLNDLWCFDIETAAWQCLQENSDPNIPSGTRHQIEAAAAAGHEQQVLERRDNNSAVRPSRRFGYVSVVHNNKLVVFGGFDGSKWLNDMYEFDFKTNTWTEIHAHCTSTSSKMLPTPRSCPAWAKDDRYVYIHGGYDGVERKSDFLACDLRNYAWYQLPCYGTPPSPRYFHSCCLYGNKMYTYGGYSGSERLSDMYVYDFETNHWSQVEYNCCASTGTPQQLPAGDSWNSTSTLENAAAGLSLDSNVDQDLQQQRQLQLDNSFIDNSPQSHFSQDIPSGRSSLVAQVYDNYLYIFGGYNGLTVLNDFYKFRLSPIRIPPTSLVQDLSHLLNSPDYADVSFLVENQVIYANRAILAIRSEYFRAMFYRSGMREQRQEYKQPVPSDQLVPIEMPDISRDIFLKVLEFLYTDSVKNMTHDICIPLLIVSEQFCLDRLQRLCEDQLRRDIDVTNVISIYITAYRHHAMGLKDIALEFILFHISDPAISNGLNDLKAEPDLLVEIIQYSSSNIIYSSTPSAPPNNNVAATVIGSGGHYSHRRLLSSTSLLHPRQPHFPIRESWSHSSSRTAPALAQEQAHGGPFGTGASEW
eukprot:CAMPEP_0172432294 /NCGR_PEP_ID=MMETSP1064-20121228/62499_1 /TAXON_ID=202472 /ORGANISM="Aulacoseira subarctica , Strain CCAP 1002/5" /LENGTH=715 /DNA_ID=CAMNT_0013179493 /DNA_START=1 /DNA_END=2145 /DNA_ORIENTATION=+